MQFPSDKPSRRGGVENIHLVLFMTAGLSLSEWHRLGMFEREVALYRRLRTKVAALTIVTFGDRRDLLVGDALPGIRIVCNRWRLPDKLYRWIASRLMPRLWRGTVVVKSNQTTGADLAFAAARTARGVFISRCGYMLSEFTARARGADSTLAQAHRLLESSVFNAADICVVTTNVMAKTVAAYGVPHERIHVIPNYVETDRLKPELRTRLQDRIGFVGRLEAQKNVLALAEAMKSVPGELIMVGGGPLDLAVKTAVQEGNARVRLVGRLPHAKMAALLNTCSVFVLPSLYEGHPKTLLEAMACGLPVVAADVPGIREVVQHGETGWLCGTDAASIAKALCMVLADGDLRERLGRSAREYIEKTCSLDYVVSLESEVLAKAASIFASQT